MPFTVDIVDQEQFFLSSELESKIDDDGDDDDYPIVTFVTNYYIPYESFLENDNIYKLVCRELESMGVSHIYKVSENINIDEISIDNIYVTKEKTKTVMNKNEIKHYKVTKLTVPIQKTRRKRELHVKNSNNNEPPCKKSKLTE